MLRNWMLGESCDILEWFAVQIEAGRTLTPFQALFLEDRFECLKNFYDRKLVPHRLMRENQGRANRLIARDELDDLLVQAGIKGT
jgi:hypothetical protein